MTQRMDLRLDLTPAEWSHCFDPCGDEPSPSRPGIGFESRLIGTIYIQDVPHHFELIEVVTEIGPTTPVMDDLQGAVDCLLEIADSPRLRTIELNSRSYIAFITPFAA